MVWRRFMPKQPSDRIAYFMMLIMIHIVGIYELFVILPYIDYERNKTFWLHASAGLFLYFNVMASFYKLFMTDSTSSGVMLPTLLMPGWQYCHTCGINTPPRSFHCWMCDVCILKRDHHCMFSGNCVGHRNQRYFLTMLFYLTVGAAYCNYLNFDYTFEVLGGLSWKSLLTMILPLLSWTVGLAGTVTFAVSFVSALCIVGSLLLTFLSLYHGQNLFLGQTCMERTQGNRTYDMGWKENMKGVFGQRWYVAWISPLIVSPLEGDGLEFRSRYRYENIKDM